MRRHPAGYDYALVYVMQQALTIAKRLCGLKFMGGREGCRLTDKNSFICKQTISVSRIIMRGATEGPKKGI